MKTAPLRFDIAESTLYTDHWHVEAVGPDGEVYVAVFSGPSAKERAIEYAAWKNRIEESTTRVQVIRGTS